MALLSGSRASFTLNFDGWQFGITEDCFSMAGVGIRGRLELGREYLIVSRLQRVDAGPEELTLWVDPREETDAPLLQGNAFVLEEGVAGLSELTLRGRMRGRGHGDIRLDEIQLGTTFGDVAGAETVPEPHVWWLLGALGLVYLARQRPTAALTRARTWSLGG